MSDRKIPPLARGIIHPADPPRLKIASTDPAGIVSYYYSPPEIRLSERLSIEIIMNRGFNRTHPSLTIEELETHIESLTAFIERAKKIEAAPHHARDWGESVPER